MNYPKLDVAGNREASNPESFSETPERPRSGSPAAAAKKRAAEVLHFLHKLEQLATQPKSGVCFDTVYVIDTLPCTVS